ncbi:MAG: DNA mismatch repair protein MutS, partial [Parcubacteria group bacterium]|nr:DNA mismatch repair protein MutS [Parcubacteria group bacterium]
MPELTPMLQQYFDVKKNYPDTIVLFRLGDFYEMFGEDAKIASKILDIALTARHKGTENEIEMCGVPHHAVSCYLAKLTKANKKAAICEQLSPPGDGLVQRQVVRVVTPGTALDTEVLEAKQNNYIFSLLQDAKIWGFSFCDLTTGEFKLGETTNFEIIKNEIFKLSPSEIIAPQTVLKTNEFQTLFNHCYCNPYQLPSWKSPEEILTSHFKIHSLASFGIIEQTAAIRAAGVLLYYLQETQKNALSHLAKPRFHNFNDCMILDGNSIRNLEILQTSLGQPNGGLISILDHTNTSMGGRFFRKWVIFPLNSKTEIDARLDAVNFFFMNQLLNETVKSQLTRIADIERIIGRIGCRRTNPKDLIALKQSLETIPVIKTTIGRANTALLNHLTDALSEHRDLIELIQSSIQEDPPINMSEGGFIKDGHHQELDELRNISKSAKTWILEFEQKEIQRTGISSLKVRYNNVFGYYIEISRANLTRAPSDYERKQTLVNCERFTTPQLKEYETKILGARDKIIALELELFEKIINILSEHLESAQKTAHALAQIDCLSGLAECAVLNRYSKPEITENAIIKIEDGRHPVIEKILPAGGYVPNDTLLDNAAHQLILLTGPNMSGKSSYIRQTALITLMAHIGSFVPAKSAAIGIVDRIFTRVGAQDYLVRGESTFMVEMQEAANIIHNATSQSLIILDELGRGTSTYDGVSLAWAIMEYIHDKIGAKTLFATHYHELIEIIEKLPKAQNYCVAVTENEHDVIFLRKIIKGGINKSYGIAVAKLAGLPSEIIARSQEILNTLENEETQKFTGARANQAPLSLDIKKEAHPILLELKKINPDNLTPLQALNI